MVVSTPIAVMVAASVSVVCSFGIPRWAVAEVCMSSTTSWAVDELVPEFLVTSNNTCTTPFYPTLLVAWIM
jgi:hypothetical protein